MKVTQTSQFKRDLKKQMKGGKELPKLVRVIDLLCSGGELPQQFQDHGLTGKWKVWRDCHIEPDWLLIYKLHTSELILGRTGTHADLF